MYNIHTMAELLSLQQVDALQAVDLRLGWIRHEETANSYTYGFPPENGPAIYGVADTDYAVPAALLSDMGPGDMSARERMFNQGWWGNAPSNSDILSDVSSLLYQSPYAGRKPLREIIEDYDNLFNQVRGDASPTAISSRPALKDGLAASIDILRKLRIGGPFLYADGLAAVKGIGRAIADSPNEDYRENKKISLEQRNSDMARGLGDVAIGLAGTKHNGNTPKVAFTAGIDHKEMQEILDSYGIAYRSKTAKRPLADTLFNLNDLFRKPSTLDIRLAQHWAHSWFKNLRRHGHTPINETLGEIRFRA